MKDNQHLNHLVLLLIACLLIACLLIAAHQTLAQEWTRFRGPNGTGIGHAPGLPLEWTLKDCLWRVELPGVGHSSPVIWGDRLYVTSAVEKDGLRIISCLHTADGRTLWRREFPMPTHSKSPNNSYASATPALDADRVYLTWATPEQYLALALKHSDGSEVWRRDLGPFDGEHGYGASPIVVDGLVVLTNEQNGPSSIVALDAATGAERWKTPRRSEKAAYSTPCLFEMPGSPPQLIVTSWAHGVSGLDPQTGRPLWELPVFTYRAVGSPLIAEGMVFAGCGGGGTGKPFVAVRPGDPARGAKAEVVYDVPKPVPYVPTPVAKDGLVFLFGDQGVMKCIDAATGAERWQKRVGGNYFGSPVRVDDRLYCISRDGELVVLAAADKYELLARINLEERSSSTPAVAGGVMYLRTVSHVMAVGPQPKR
ncbi:MAG: PQQ-like beta-propeller repeat protein [Pirellulales bacterium]|nr:PQQ-like beta-propeller repeat protein [Pirellulales bacterium]